MGLRVRAVHAGAGQVAETNLKLSRQLLLVSALLEGPTCQAQSLAYLDAQSPSGAVAMMKTTLRIADRFRQKCVSRFPDLADSIDKDLAIWKGREEAIIRLAEDQWLNFLTLEPRLPEAISASVSMAESVFEKQSELPEPMGRELVASICARHFSTLASGVWRERTPNAYRYLEDWVARPVVRSLRPIKASGDYEEDLMKLYSVARWVEWMRDGCSEEFPDQKDRNDDFYSQWRMRNSKVLDFLEEHATRAPISMTGPNLRDQVDSLMPDLKKELLADTRSHGPKMFYERCDSYPAFLRADRTDLAYTFSNLLDTIRRGP